MPGNFDEVKRKIRKLKKLEIRIRFGGAEVPRGAGLIYDRFFDINDTGDKTKKYGLKYLAALDKDEYREIVDEFIFHVYYLIYGVRGPAGSFDPEILDRLGLRHDADENDIKRKFRELAKKYHPDNGGDSSKFVELMDSYRRLL